MGGGRHAGTRSSIGERTAARNIVHSDSGIKARVGAKLGGWWSRQRSGLLAKEARSGAPQFFILPYSATRDGQQRGPRRCPPNLIMPVMLDFPRAPRLPFPQPRLRRTKAQTRGMARIRFSPAPSEFEEMKLDVYRKVEIAEAIIGEFWRDGVKGGDSLEPSRAKAVLLWSSVYRSVNLSSRAYPVPAFRVCLP